MRKIPSLFKRDYEGTRRVYPEIVLGCEWVIAGEGVATIKLDGTCCLVRDGKLYKRYDAKKGKQAPDGWEPCESAPDPNTGHWPGWLPVGDGPDDRWHRKAWNRRLDAFQDGTYELVGPRINGGSEGYLLPTLVPHNTWVLPNAPREFDAIRDYLSAPVYLDLDGYRYIEGIVWWRDLNDQDCDKAKIKRRDFGLPWPAQVERHNDER